VTGSSANCGRSLRSFRKKGSRHGQRQPGIGDLSEKEHHVKITAAMNRCGLLSICCAKFVEARFFMDNERFELVFCHESLPDGDLRAVISAAKSTPVIVLSRFAEWDHYLDALRAGAYDYIACPPDPAETERIVWSALGNARAIADGAVH
jgi:two-component system response regulator PilR (NtrC family)